MSVGRETEVIQSLLARVFVSHASEDKLEHVRPLVQALAFEGVSLWLDRPSAGEGNFGFDENFIRKYDIKGLVAGLDWDEQIMEAHRSSGAVLACLSRHLSRERQVLVQEVAFARYAGKLVACIVDDLPFEDIPSNLGLLDTSKLQAPRVNTAILTQAVDALTANPSLLPSDLTPALAAQWQIVRRLVVDINRVFAAGGLVRISEADLAAVRAVLRSIPVGPMVRAFEIPMSIIDLFAERLHEPPAARRYFALAMGLALQCADRGHTASQTIVSAGDVINPERNPIAQFWTDVLTQAGQKSRRTLAALIIAPGPLAPACLPEHTAREVGSFVAWLKSPDMQWHF